VRNSKPLLLNVSFNSIYRRCPWRKATKP
jgi:hypothetical protein